MKTPIDPKLHKLLIEQFVPRLRQVKNDRRSMQLVMIVVLLIPLLVSVVLVFRTLVAGGESKLEEGVIATGLLGVSSVCFIYLGKIQSCNDELLDIELAVFEGDQDRLHDTISKLGCLGNLRGILNDVRRITTQRE
jgi:hypothetical protein